MRRPGPTHGVAWGNWLVSKTSGFLDAKLSRRSFIARTTLVGSAVAVAGGAAVTQRASAYQTITACPPGSLCTDGYTEFCCVINGGVNACPPNTMPAGWWRADGSIYCGGGPRYYIDCNQVCCGPGVGNGFCAGCVPCQCAVDCNTRRIYCNYFRYGQCNTQVPYVGPIGCRMVTCVPPYQLNIGCDPSGAVDNATANHTANCPPPPSPPPPPPPPPAVLPASAAAIGAPAGLFVFGRAPGGSMVSQSWDGANWSAWQNLGGGLTSRISAGSGGGQLLAVVRGNDNAIWANGRNGSSWGGWLSLGGQATSDPTLAIDHNGTGWVFTRGNDHAVWVTAVGGNWLTLGGAATSDPSAVIDASNNPWVFVRGGNNVMYVQVYAGGSWTGWLSLGGAASSDPAAVCDTTTNTVWCFVRGGDGAIYSHSIHSGNFSGWQSLGGGATSDPTAVVDANGNVYVFVRGGDSALYVNIRISGSWTGWQSLGGGIAADPTPLFALNAVWVLAQGNDSQLYVQIFDGNHWSGWLAMGQTVAPVRGAASG
jgi:hypothetical protein